MHHDLICYSWQEDEPGTLPKDEKKLQNLLEFSKKNDWKNRVFPQLLTAWKTWEEDPSRLIQYGLRREYIKQKARSTKAKNGANARWGKDANASLEHMPQDALHKEEEVEEEVVVKGLTKSKGTKPTIEVRKVWFREDWGAYPRKDGDKAKAEKCYLKSVTTLEKRKLFQKKMQEYVDSVDNPIYFKHGETFFRNWENLEVSGITSKNGNKKTPAQQVSEGRGEWIDGVLSAYGKLKEVPKILKQYPKEDEKLVLKVLYDFQYIESLPE